MLYFDSAATTFHRPRCVQEAVITAITTFGNPSRSAHAAAMEATRTITACRYELHNMFHNSDPSRVIFTANATAALNIAVQSLQGHIITTAAEHNSVLRPIYKKNNYTILPCDEYGAIDFSKLASSVRKDTTAVVMTHASNVIGKIYNLEDVGIFCKTHQLNFIVDASQTAGLLQIDMTKTGISALCISGHKSLLGPQGTGALLLNDDFSPSPLMVGGSGTHSFGKEQPGTYPEYLEAGTLNSHGIAGLLAGLQYLSQLPQDYAYHKVMDLSDHFYKEISKIESLITYGKYSREECIPVFSLNIKGLDSAELAFILANKYNIAVRSGIHCAPLMHKALGTQDLGTVRFSFSHLNTMAEIDNAIAALSAITTIQTTG